MQQGCWHFVSGGKNPATKNSIAVVVVGNKVALGQAAEGSDLMV